MSRSGPTASSTKTRTGFRAAIQPASIDHIEREPIKDAKVHLDRTYYRWTIDLNWPKSSEITFGAVGFTQTLRTEPVLRDQQALTRPERDRLLGR